MDDIASTDLNKFVQVKMLILFVMSRLSVPISHDRLTELASCDDRINYFDITDCIQRLIKSKHLQKEDNKYTLTAKGLKSSEILEEDLPLSVRQKAENATSRIKESVERDYMIKTQVDPVENGGSILEMSMSDGVGEILSVRLITADKKQADALIKGFREKAYNLYHEIVQLLMKD